MDYFDDFGWCTTDPAFSHRVASEPCPTTSPAEGSGWNWTGFAWVELRIPTPPVDPEPVTQVRHITKLAFMNRFTDAEAIALDLASIGATVNAAAIRRYKEKITVATFIDLDRQDTRAGVQALETLGLLAEGRALIILDSTIQEEEIFKGQ